MPMLPSALPSNEYVAVIRLQLAKASCLFSVPMRTCIPVPPDAGASILSRVGVSSSRSRMVLTLSTSLNSGWVSIFVAPLR
ncbi:hypothetical protein D3C86_1913240 [compost metagenome]